MSTRQPTGLPGEGTNVDGMRVEFVAGGDPGIEVVAAVTAVLTRPVVVLDGADGDADETGPSAWVRAARLESIVHGRRITTRADLAWRR